MEKLLLLVVAVFIPIYCVAADQDGYSETVMRRVDLRPGKRAMEDELSRICRHDSDPGMRRAVEILASNKALSDMYPGSEMDCSSSSGKMIIRGMEWWFRDGDLFKIVRPGPIGLDREEFFDKKIDRVKISDGLNYIFIAINLVEPAKSEFIEAHLPVLAETKQGAVSLRNELVKALNEFYRKKANIIGVGMDSLADALLLSPKMREIFINTVTEETPTK